MLAHRTELPVSTRGCGTPAGELGIPGRHFREYSQLDTGSFVRQGDGNNLTAPWESC